MLTFLHFLVAFVGSMLVLGIARAIVIRALLLIYVGILATLYVAAEAIGAYFTRDA